MAKERVVQLIDDLDGSNADETVRFALDENIYEIDLTSANARRLRTTLDRYRERGRRVGRVRLLAPGQRPKRRTRTSNGEQAAARVWAGQNGYPIQPVGQVPKVIMAEYRASKAASASE